MLLRVIIILLSLFNAGYMLADGLLAWFKGDYIRPSGGEYAGQLGPWAKVVGTVGIDPMSGLMKTIFVALGFYGLIACWLFITNSRNGWLSLFIFSVLSLWYLMFGTMSAVIVMVLLLIYRVK